MNARVTHIRGVRDASHALCNDRLVSGVAEDPRRVTCRACLRALFRRAQFHNLLLVEAKKRETS